MTLPDPTAAPTPERPSIRRARRVAEWISVTLFAALFLTFVAQVFWRYVLSDPLVWTLEVAGILFVTVSLFTAASQMAFRDHVGLDLFLLAFPPAVRRLLIAVSMGLFAVVMAWSVPDTVRVLEWMYRERTYAIDFNLGHLFVLMIVFVIAYVLRAVMTVVRMFRPGWRDEV